MLFSKTAALASAAAVVSARNKVCAAGNPASAIIKNPQKTSCHSASKLRDKLAKVKQGQIAIVS